MNKLNKIILCFLLIIILASCSKHNNTFIDNDTGIKVVTEDDLPKGTVLKVTKDNTNYNFKDIKMNKYIAYDISLVNANNKLEDLIKAEVYIKIPADFDHNKLVIYYVKDNNFETFYPVTVKGEYAKFNAIHFSTYLLVEAESDITLNSNNNQSNRSINNMNKLNITINNKDYILNLENNKTVNELLSILPIDTKMNELNGNEYYAYLDNSFTTNSYNPKEIKAGDVMLYGNNCLVIFYKSFKTTYSYTKIGHIDSLETLDTSYINVHISK